MPARTSGHCAKLLQSETPASAGLQPVRHKAPESCACMKGRCDGAEVIYSSNNKRYDPREEKTWQVRLQRERWVGGGAKKSWALAFDKQWAGLRCLTSGGTDFQLGQVERKASNVKLYLYIFFLFEIKKEYSGNMMFSWIWGFCWIRTFSFNTRWYN